MATIRTFCGDTMIEQRIFCDVCRQENPTLIGGSVQVIVYQRQNKKTDYGPYLDMRELDLCPECLSKVLEGNYIFDIKEIKGYINYVFKV
jgi:hypothetical protein